MEDTIHIFLTSPMEVRTRRIMERHSLTEEKAESLISHKDKSREEYYNYYTFGNWGKASDYDICMDSSILGIEGTAEFIIRLAQMKGILKEGDNE
jgi:cytidylate kinase